METTPSGVMTNIRTYIGNINTAVASSPTYTTLATNLDNIAISKATPSNGIITFTFKLDGITVSIAYRDE